MSTATLQSIPDFSDPDTFALGVPHEAFDEIRSRKGLYWQPAKGVLKNGGFWVLTRREDIVAAEADFETFTTTRGAAYPQVGGDPTPEFQAMIFTIDPPTHSRVRRAAAKSFGPRVVANFEEWVNDIVVEALDDALEHQEFDWIQEIAVTIPARVIARVLGVPEEDRQKIVDWAVASFKGFEDDATGARTAEIMGEIFAYVEQLRQLKLTDPKSDMITELAQSVESGAISHTEFLFYVVSLMTAGFETTHTLIGQSARMMLDDPEVERIFHETMESDGAEPVIEEFLRMITPAMNFARTVTKDTVFSGQSLRESDVVLMQFVAANRDPEVFEDPHRFWPGRPRATDHLAFGSGAHRCIGQALARLEMRVLFEEMERRHLRLTLNGEPKRGHSTFINQLFALPVKVA